MINKQKFLEGLEEFLNKNLSEETVSGVGPTASSISSSNKNLNQIQTAITGAQQILKQTEQDEARRTNQDNRENQEFQRKKQEAFKKINSHLTTIQKLNSNIPVNPSATTSTSTQSSSGSPQTTTSQPLINIPTNISGV